MFSTTYIAWFGCTQIWFNDQKSQSEQSLDQLEKFGMIFIGMKRFLFFWKKKIKMAESKKISKSPILKIFLQKFDRFVIGLVGLIDAKRIDVAQHIWPWGCPTKGLKQGKNRFLVFFSHFWVYVRQPHDHIGWATLLAFASINPTNPRANLWNFRIKISRIVHLEKRQFWKIGHFEFFSSKKNFFFLLDSHENQSKFVWYNGWVEILMFSLVSRKFLAMRNIVLYSVSYPTFLSEAVEASLSHFFEISLMKLKCWILGNMLTTINVF